MIFKYFLSLSPLSQRIYTALCLGTLFFGCLYAGVLPFLALLGLFLFLSLKEWFTVLRHSSFMPLKKNLWLIFGTAYIIIGFCGIAFVSQENRFYVLYFLMLIWATDIGAFFIGRALGGPKLAPHISPAKTWSGACGGIILSLSLGFIFLYVLNKPLTPVWIVLIISISVISIFGDLIESYAKRQIGIKDTGSLLPGHGGVLDRLDSPLAVGFLLSCDAIYHTGSPHFLQKFLP